MLVSKPHNLFLFAAIISLIISVFFGNNLMDFYIHDTVFVVAALDVFIVLALLFLFFWFVYKISNRVLLSKALTSIHIIITLLFFAFFLTGSNSYPHRYNPTKLEELKNVFAPILIVSFLFSQFLFFFNIIAGIMRKRK
jgi:heme/copper-type cytochrome/quinol oxidase subunit 1